MAAHLLDSFAMNCENSSGLLDDSSSPLAVILLINAGSVSACRVALFKDVTTLFGIFLGPNNPTQTVTSKFGKLDSAIVGILGKLDNLLLTKENMVLKIGMVGNLNIMVLNGGTMIYK